MVPGNSGYPEFQFFVNQTLWVKPDSQYSADYQFQGHYLVPVQGFTLEEIRSRFRQSQAVLTDGSDENRLANFREVRGGQLGSRKLYRSYHPFIASKKEQPLERERLQAVKKLMEASKIRSVINLSDKKSVLELKSIPPYYRSIGEQENILFAETHYDTAYYHPDSPEFARLLREVFEFIAVKEPPFLVHCRLGTDRTGVVTAVISAFMGCSWDEISEDFEKTNLNQLGEYRSRNLLAYSFFKMTGKMPASGSLPEKEIRSFLTDKAGIPAETLNRVYRVLKAE
jgi:protein tyrosine/serine phosphatase